MNEEQVVAALNARDMALHGQRNLPGEYIPRSAIGYWTRWDADTMHAAIVAAQGAAPVLPSSGVDEDAMAEVIRQQFEVGNIYLDSFECKIAARAVAAWLEGQGVGKY